ncbi:hypothetical protein DRE_01040 [Drechslerella stenobrocha 248]|uniref:PH-response regulator protein palI/RIM9 n=1 Tax=Drechslerella stenobrocha 248 TaxID=1043628 RepID=W7HLY2_9PEZI|nr:hypothetical protein DRE_01040 [Drechslerella stenobrocha 248]
MIRAATPLTILLLAAFALLLISILSVPIIKPITLATYQNVDYGVFGYCVNEKCSPIEVGYNPDIALKDPARTDFTLPSKARHSLSSLLIIHPIAAALTLVLTILAACSHLHGPANNPRFLLATLLFALPTFLTSLLAFLVDILLFIPHLQWGGWIVLAATICILTAGVMTCAMRRTVVSRAAQKARIATNSEMNGDIYREQQAGTTAPTYGNPSTSAGGNSSSSATPLREPKLPDFATFDVTRKPSTDTDRTPLNPRNQTPQPQHQDLPVFPAPQPNAPGGFDPNVPRHPTPGRDEFNPSLSRQRSNHTMNSDNFGPPSTYDRNGTPPVPPLMMGPGGRGGYPMRGGSMRGRGGPGMGPPRGGFGPHRGGMGMGPRGGPGMGPRGGGPYRGRGGPNGFYVGGPGGPMNPMEDRPYIGPGPPPVFMRPGDPGPGFDSDNMYGPPPRQPMMDMPPIDPRSGNPYGPPPRRPTNELPRDDMGYMQPENQRYASPPPSQRRPTNEFSRDDLGYMQSENPRYASPPPLPPSRNEDRNHYNNAYEMDAAPIMPLDPVGMAIVGPPGQARSPSPALQSPGSKYSQEEYVPPRTAWVAAGMESSPNNNPPAELPVELPTSLPSPPQPQPAPSSPTRARHSQDYYEDVEPRFDAPPVPNNALPSILTAGYAGPPPTMAIAEYPPDTRERSPPPMRDVRPVQPLYHTGGGNGSDEELQPGQRSPAMSTSSQFTSISQRGVNPRWPGDGPSVRRPPPRQPDAIFSSNPDFELPTRGGRGGRRGAFGY